ncbi:MAG: hypothetical protein NTV39_01755 [Candidatus Saccharibacteria bacterium]|nr:hypothetical protein [Candidatus Saccharibacteria bacterium]
MPNNNLTRIVPKNYQSFIQALPGSNMWRHLYVSDQDGREIDVTEGGNKSCAYMVSSVLCIFQLIDKPHATVNTTLKHMLEAGWQKIDKPIKGAVVHWEEHLGFYLADDFVISNNSSKGYASSHGLVMDDGSKPIDFYIHSDIILN